MAVTNSRFSLDVREDVWTAHMAGVGGVSVLPDGHYTVTLEQKAADRDQVIDRMMLTHGWAEPLSLMRQGWLLGFGAILVSNDGQQTVLLTGDSSLRYRMEVGFVEDGWSFLADGLVPYGRGNGTECRATAAPVLTGRTIARKEELTVTEYSSDSDVVMWNVPRVSDSHQITARVHLANAKPHDPPYDQPSPHIRIQLARSFIISNPSLIHDASQTHVDLFQSALHLAQIPTLLVHTRNEQWRESYAHVTDWLAK